MDRDFDDTLTGVQAADIVEHAAPDLDDTVIGGVAPGALGEEWPEPSWPAALDPVAAEVPVYSFRVGRDNEPVALDRVVYIGRKPALPRIVSGQHPLLISVPSPRSEVSSTHIELRQNGHSVVVTDLRSTNGSIVVIPGSAPRRMRQGESVVVTPGTFIDIGDGNSIEILSTRLRYSEGEL